jgi:chromate reductase
MTQIAVFVGSIRADSFNKKLAKNLEKFAPEGVAFTYADIAVLPLFDQDVEASAFPAEVQAIKEIVAGADAVLFVTPEYNHSFTGVLKNAIDWVSRPWGVNTWGGKPTGIVGASISPSGTAFAQAALASIVEWFKSPLYTDQHIKLTVTDDTFNAEGVLNDDVASDAKAYIEGFVAWVNENPSKPEVA